jgi:hypothetical protein
MVALPKEEYTPEVAEHHPNDPLSEDATRHSEDNEDESFGTRTVHEAAPLPAVGSSLFRASKRMQ